MENIRINNRLHYIISDHLHLQHILSNINDKQSVNSRRKFLEINNSLHNFIKGKKLNRANNKLNYNGDYLDFKLYSIQGNAGTGKTQTIIDLLLTLPRCIVCSSTNSAAKTVLQRIKEAIPRMSKDTFIGTTVHSLLGWNIGKYMMSAETTRSINSLYTNMKSDMVNYNNNYIQLLELLSPLLSHLTNKNFFDFTNNEKLSALINIMQSGTINTKKGKNNNRKKRCKRDDRLSCFGDINNQCEFLFALETHARTVMAQEMPKLCLGNYIIIEEAGRLPAYFIHLVVYMWWLLNDHFNTPQCEKVIPYIILVGSTSQSTLIDFDCSMLDECQLLMRVNDDIAKMSLFTYNRRMKSNSDMADVLSHVQNAIEFGEVLTLEMEHALEPLVVENLFYDPSFKPEAIRIVKKHSDAQKYVSLVHNSKFNKLAIIEEYVFVAGNIRTMQHKRKLVSKPSNKNDRTTIEYKTNKWDIVNKYRRKGAYLKKAISGKAEDMLNEEEFAYEYEHKHVIFEHIHSRRNQLNFMGNSHSLNNVYTDVIDMGVGITVEMPTENTEDEIDKNRDTFCITYHLYKLKREIVENCSLIVNNRVKVKLLGFMGSFMELVDTVENNHGLLPSVYILRISLEFVEKFVACFDIMSFAGNTNDDFTNTHEITNRVGSDNWALMNDKLHEWKNTANSLNLSHNPKPEQDDYNEEFMIGPFLHIWQDIISNLSPHEEFCNRRFEIIPSFTNEEFYITKYNTLANDINTCHFIGMSPFIPLSVYKSALRYSEYEYLPTMCHRDTKTICGKLWEELRDVADFNLTMMRLLIDEKYIVETIPQFSPINWKSVFPRDQFFYHKPNIEDIACDPDDEENIMSSSSTTERACVIGLFLNCTENIAQTIDYSQGSTIHQPVYLDVDSCTNQQDLLVGITRPTSIENLILTSNKISHIPQRNNLKNTALNVGRHKLVYNVC